MLTPKTRFCPYVAIGPEMILQGKTDISDIWWKITATILLFIFSVLKLICCMHWYVLPSFKGNNVILKYTFIPLILISHSSLHKTVICIAPLSDLQDVQSALVRKRGDYKMFSVALLQSRQRGYKKSGVNACMTLLRFVRE